MVLVGEPWVPEPISDLVPLPGAMGGVALCRNERVEDLEIKRGVFGARGAGERMEASSLPSCHAGSGPMPGVGITTNWPVEHHWSTKGHGAKQRQQGWEMSGETLVLSELVRKSG